MQPPEIITIDMPPQGNKPNSVTNTPTIHSPHVGSNLKEIFLRYIPAGHPSSTLVAIGLLISAIPLFFLCQYLVNIAHTKALFFGGSYAIFTSYFTIHYYLTDLSSSYRSISTEDHKFYIVSNLIKGIILASLTPFALHLLYKALFHDEWDTNAFRNLGCMYAIPDFVSLLLVKKMSRATKVHHICVCLMCCWGCQNDYQQENICRLMLVCAVFSAFSYLVNLFLAISQLKKVSRQKFIMVAALSLMILASTSIINWTWQMYYIHRLFILTNHWNIYVYSVLLSALIYDDLTLMKWLWSVVYEHCRRSSRSGDEQKNAK